MNWLFAKQLKLIFFEFKLDFNAFNAERNVIVTFGNLCSQQLM